MHETVIDQLIETHPRLKMFRPKLEAMQAGAYCLHPSWGFGQIESYDSAQNRLIINFDSERKNHAMDPVFCVDKLDILPANHLLVRKHTETKVIEDLVKNKPAELVIQALNTYPNQTASSTELERLLAKTVGETRFKKWWLGAKKQIEQDPRIACPTRKNEPYILRDEPLAIENEILENFHQTKHPKTKILIAEKLLNLAQDTRILQEELPKVLDALTDCIQTAKQLSDAERLYGVWIRNDLARHLDIDVDNFEPTSAYLLENAKERLTDLAENLPIHFQKRLLSLLKRVYPEKWTDMALLLLKNSNGKFTQECVNFLVDEDQQETLQFALEKWLGEQSLKSPLITWILKNRDGRKFTHILKPILTPKLLAAAFYAIDYEALQLTTNRRIPLAEFLSDDTELIADLLADTPLEIAHDLANSLMTSQGFEELTKKSLMARFIKRFPSTQSLINHDGPKEAEKLIVSATSYEARKKEYENLVNHKIPENKQAIATAREHGDLKENSEYKMARQDQEVLLARKALLETELSKAIITDFSDASADTVSIGSVIEALEGSHESIQTFTILGAWDSDPDKHILSYKTPLAQTLLGKKVGDRVEIEIAQNKSIWTVKKISRWVDVR